jgi:hypothetical protein
MQSGYKQGIFKPQNASKYMGSTNPTFRSGWELKFFRWADLNENILFWGSETIIIPYVNPLDNKVHRYFVDNFIVFKDKNGNKQKFLIEIKPSKQVNRPIDSNRKKPSTVLYERTTWITNQAKWEAAKKWADKKGCQFIILTEKELGIR